MLRDMTAPISGILTPFLRGSRIAHGLKVLLTNVCMHGRCGTGINVSDLPCSLLRQGHTPIVYSPVQGGLTMATQTGTGSASAPVGTSVS
jgi:hypothetical protein